MTSLSEHLESVYEMPETEAHERFRIESTDQANWALRKLKKIRDKQAENDRLASDEIGRIQRWLSDVNSQLEREAGFFESLLVEYHRALLSADPEAKTVKLPMGTLRARQIKPQPELVDEEAALEWAKAHAPGLVKVKESLAWAEMKKELDILNVRDGPICVWSKHCVIPPEPVPGTAVKPGEIRFRVEVS